MEMSAEINELATALAKAQAKIEGASKDGLNPHFKSRYATLAAVWEAARGPLSENGLSIAQGASAVAEFAERVTITTVLMHSSGQWMKETLTMSCGTGRPQEVGSAISYARRYQLAAMVGVAPEDDDAEAAEARPVTSSRPAVPSPPRPPVKTGDEMRRALQQSIRKPNPQQEPPPPTDLDGPF